MEKIKTYLDPLNPQASLVIDDTWLDDDLYMKVVKKTVVSCVDAVVTVKDVPDTVYLIRRAVYPMKGLWILGGRIQFNSVNIQDAISSNVMRETKVRFSPERFKLLTVNNYFWINCAQGNFPSKILAPLFHLEVSKEELSKISSGLIASEYEQGFGLQPFTREYLIRENVHPAILDAFDLIWL